MPCDSAEILQLVGGNSCLHPQSANSHRYPENKTSMSPSNRRQISTGLYCVIFQNIVGLLPIVQGVRTPNVNNRFV